MNPQKFSKFVVWAVGLSILAYFLFLPVDFTRKKPQEISPIQQEIPTPKPEELKENEFPSISTPTEPNY